MVELGTGRDAFAIIDHHSERAAPERRRDLGNRAVDPVGVFVTTNRDNHHLIGSDRRREHQPLGITVRHDERTDEPGADTPARHLDEAGGARLVEVLHARHPGEVLTKVMNGAHLEPLAVRHEAFDTRRLYGPRELLAVGLATHHGRNGQGFGNEIMVLTDDFFHLSAGLDFGGVGGVTLLPLELRVPEEEAWALLPTDDVRPLIEAQRQIPVGTNPPRHTLVDDRFGSRTDDEGLLERFAAGVGDHGAFGREPGDVILLPGEERLRDEEREGNVRDAPALDAPVEFVADKLPDRVAVRPDDHATAYGCVFGQFGPEDHFLIPVRKR